MLGQFLVGPDFPIVKFFGYRVKIPDIWSEIRSNLLQNLLVKWLIWTLLDHFGLKIA